VTAYTYYAGDGTLLRNSDPIMHRLEIYRGNGQWDTYPTTESFWTTRDNLTETEAQQRITELDHEAQRYHGRGAAGPGGIGIAR
jgi:hypothetical protein